MTGLANATVFRLISTLENMGYLIYEEQLKGYRLGKRVLLLGSVAMGSADLARIALPIMEKLGQDTGETITLFVRKYDTKICIQIVDSNHIIRFTDRVGSILPIYVGSSGKVLLSGLSDEQIERLLDSLELVPLTPNTVIDKQDLLKQIRVVRKQGYAISVQERLHGAAGISCPVYGPAGEIIASLNNPCPVERFNESTIPKWLELVKEAAFSISEQMGYRRPKAKGV